MSGVRLAIAGVVVLLSTGSAGARDAVPDWVRDGLFYLDGDAKLACGFEKRGDSYYAVNGRGEKSKVTFKANGKGTVIRVGEGDDLTGDVDENDRCIKWSDQTTWVASDSPYRRTFYMEGRRAEPTRLAIIKQQPYAVNERGEKSRIVWHSPTEFVATEWGGGVKGTLKAEKNFLTDGIQWSDGVVWSANWYVTTFYYGGGKAEFKVFAGKPVAVNEHGQTTRLRWLSAADVVALDWGSVSGKITSRGVEWKDGVVWAQFPPPQAPPPPPPEPRPRPRR